MGPEQPESAAAAAPAGEGQHGNTREDEEPGDVGGGLAGAPHAEAVGQGIDGDGKPGQERQADGLGLAVANLAAGRAGQAHDAGRDRQHAGPLQAPQGFALDGPGAEGGQNRRRAAGDGVDQRQVAVPVGDHQNPVVEVVDDRRDQEVGPGLRRRQGHEGDDAKGRQAGREDDQRERHQLVRAGLDESVPSGMQHRRQQDQKDDEGVHAWK